MSELASGELATAARLNALIQDPVVTATGGNTQRFTSLRFAAMKNPMDYGAAGDGTADDHAAIQLAADAVPSTGGVLYLEPKKYKISENILLKSKTVLYMPGAWIRPVAEASWQSSSFWGISNVNNAEASITDEDIFIFGGFIDYTDLISSPDGSRHPILMRKVRNLRIENVRTYGGNSAFAMLGCEDTLVTGCHAEEFRNCGIDHWDAAGSARLSDNYLKTSETNQMVNFNPENTTVPYVSGQAAVGLTMTGNHLISTDATQDPCQIEPLSANSTYVEQVVITGNRFQNVSLTLRGDIRSAIVSGNSFSDNLGGGSVITVGDIFSGSPGVVNIVGNVIRNPTTSTGFGVIRHNGAEGAVVGNGITGFAPDDTDAPAISITNNTVVRAGNYSDHLGLEPFGIMQVGGGNIGNGDILGFFDASGSRAKLKVQTDNNMVLLGTGTDGSERILFSIKMRDGDSEFLWAAGHRFDTFSRYLPSDGLTAAGTTQGTAPPLVRARARVSTVASGAGVRLPAPADATLTGTTIRVVNAGANALLIYPNSGAAIDALSTNAAYSLAAGAARWFYAWSDTEWESWA